MFYAPIGDTQVVERDALDQEQHELIKQLQATVDRLSARVDELSDRLDRVVNEHGESVAPPDPIEPGFEPKQPEVVPETIVQPVPKPIVSPITKPAANPVPRMQKRVAPVKKKPVIDLSKFEWMLGIRGLMLVGVIVIVVGVGMFLKLARDEGWIAAISPAMRCLSAGGFGLLLVGLGEFLRKKLNPHASTGFTAAGIATVYATILASTKMFGLIEPPAAFVLLFAVTAMGIWLGSLSNRVLLSLLSLVGAFAVPILLADGEPSRVMLPLYLLALLTMGLVLSGWRGGHYSYVRQLAWWGTGIVGSIWIASMHKDAPASTLCFVGVAWLMTVVELAVSARFFKTLRDRHTWLDSSGAGFLVDEDGEIGFDPWTLFFPESRWINALFGATVWAVIASGVTLRGIDESYEFLSPLGFGVLSVMFVAIGSHPKIGLVGKICAQSSSPRSLFGAALVINAAMLVVATIAVAFTGWLQVVAWILVGLAAIETGRRIRFRAAGLFGMALLAVALGRLVTIDFFASADSKPAAVMLGIALTDWTLQMSIMMVALISAWWRSRYAPERVVALCVAFWVACFACFHNKSELQSIGSAWILIAGAGCWIAYWLKTYQLRINSMVIAIFAMFVVVYGQLSPDKAPDIELDVHVASLLIAAGVWVLVSAIPSNGFVSRSFGALLATICVMFALVKIESTMGAAEMLVFQGVVAIALLAIGKRLYAWSLNEIASLASMYLAAGWVFLEMTSGTSTLSGSPLLRADSLAVGITLVALLWSVRAIPRRKIALDAPENIAQSRRSLVVVFGVVFWFLLLGASTLEVVRATRIVFDASSAKGAAVSIWWSVFAIASVGFGFRFHKALRWGGLTLIGLVAVKVLLIDTMTLAPAARIVAAITVGMIIIATGVLYSRLIASVEGEPEAVEDAQDEAG